MLPGRFRDSIAIRMQAGEPVHETLLTECHRRGISSAFVSSGIGMLDTPELACYDFSIMGYQTKSFPGRHERSKNSANSCAELIRSAATTYRKDNAMDELSRSWPKEQAGAALHG